MPRNVGSAAQSALNSGPGFVAASAVNPSGKEFENAARASAWRGVGLGW